MAVKQAEIIILPWNAASIISYMVKIMGKDIICLLQVVDHKKMYLAQMN